MSMLLNLCGMKFGRLTAISYVGRDPRNGKTTWLCKCDCGSEKTFSATSLRTGNTTSCGCKRRESLARVHTKHGMAKRKNVSPEFSVWKDIIKRCTNPNRDDYKYYGGRGISVCERWKEFANFYADMGKRPPGMTIDRINTFGNYEPGNCRWITIQEQQNNKRSCIYLEHDGRKLNMKQWSRELGVSYDSFRNHIKSGKTISDFLQSRGL